MTGVSDLIEGSAEGPSPSEEVEAARGKRQFAREAGGQVEALIQGNDSSEPADSAGGEKRHFAGAGEPTLEPGAGGLAAAKDEEPKPTIGLVAHAGGHEDLLKHESAPSDLSGATKPTKRVFEGLSGGAESEAVAAMPTKRIFEGKSGGVETQETVKPMPKRSKTRRETTAGDVIYPPQQAAQAAEAPHKTIKVIAGVRNKQDHFKDPAADGAEKQPTTRRHFLKELNQDQVAPLLQPGTDAKQKIKETPSAGDRVAGRASVDINAAAERAPTAAATAAASGTGVQSCLSWDA